jgi:hypothetical protein
MSKSQTKDLLKALKPFPKEIKERVLALREFVWDMYPTSNELIYDNYNAVAFGWSLTDRVSHLFCNMAIGRSSHNVHFGFYWGAEISDPEKMLIGEGNQYRYILVPDLKKFPKRYMTKLIRESYALSKKKVKNPNEIKEGLTILKSVSAKKRASSKKKNPVKKR